MQQNIFFLFPPGYSGNYLQWIINASDTTTATDTIKDPLLSDGTSHGFIRRPTHSGVFNILNWLVKNKIEKCQTFVIYAYNNTDAWYDHPAYAAYCFLKSFPDALMVNIYAETDDYTKIAALNSYTKWITWIYDTAALEPNRILDFDWEGGKNDRVSLKDRNWFLDNWRSTFFINDRPFNWEEFNYNVDCFQKWLQVRQDLEHQEMDQQQWNWFDPVPRNNIFDLKLEDIYREDFVDSHDFFAWIKSMDGGEFDWNYAKDYHKKYLEAQDNLRFNSEIRNLRANKIISPWLLKNSLSQAFVLEEIKTHLDHVPDWPHRSTIDILTNLGYSAE